MTYIVKKQNMVPVTIRLPVEVLDRIRESGQNTSCFIRDGIRMKFLELDQAGVPRC